MSIEFDEKLLCAIEAFDSEEAFVHFLKTDFDISKIIIRDGDGNILDESADPANWDLPKAEARLISSRDHLDVVTAEVFPQMPKAARKKQFAQYRKEIARRQEDAKKSAEAYVPPTTKSLLRQIISSLVMLENRAKKGEIAAIEAIRDSGLESSLILERLTFEETEKSNKTETPENEFRRGGAAREVARNSRYWPFRLHSIAEMRSGTEKKPPNNSTFNPESYAEFLSLGSNLETKVGSNRGKGRKRDFSGQSSITFVDFVYRHLNRDIKTYADSNQISYIATFESDRDYPANWVMLLAAYHDSLRQLPPLRGSVTNEQKTAWATAAAQWAELMTRGDMSRTDCWPKCVLREAKNQKDGNILEGIKSLFRKEIASLIG
jgi:hypothetical protein